MTPLGKYIKQSGIAQKKIAEAAGLTPERLNGLCNDHDDLLYGDDFYAIVKAIDNDINKACNEIFKSYKLKTVTNTWNSDLGRYLFKHAKPTKAITAGTKIKSGRLSKLLNDAEKRPYAWELYVIALFLEKEPKEVFGFLFAAI
ncbi:hypothetical protein [Sinomicrobium oceani]|uniref:hypothetical protein n=1 Tax=Sinomicrobium oceani TaxID=1150368 RepID=UPI00227BC6FD|nr:hypothetical protein [Sinomicrobium oceani]